MNPFNLDLFKGYTDKNPVTVTLDEAVRLITTDNALKTPPALHHIGRIMKEAGYTAVRRAGRRGYLVARLDSEHIEAARRMLGRE